MFLSIAIETQIETEVAISGWGISVISLTMLLFRIMRSLGTEFEKKNVEQFRSGA